MRYEDTEAYYMRPLPKGTKIHVKSTEGVVDFEIPGIKGTVTIPFESLKENPEEALFDAAYRVVKALHPELFKENNE